VSQTVPVTYEIDLGETRCSRSRSVFQQTGQVFELNPLSDPRWKLFVESHPDASVFHRVEWLQALNSCYGYMPAALTLSRPESPLENGLLLCEVRSRLTGSRLVSIPFSDHCEPLISGSEELDTFLAHLAKRIKEERWRYFELRPILHTFDEQQRISISQSYYLHRLDLRPSLETLYKQFHKDSVQRKIRRAEREALRYEEGNSETLLRHFYKLMIMTRRRHGLPPQPLKWFRAVLACLGRNAQIRVALKGETPVASILTLTTPTTMTYKYGCSDSRFSNLGGTALLFWNAIRQAKAQGIEQFDLGRSDIANTGLITFKERWGAGRCSVNYWRHPVKAASYNPEHLIKHAQKLISISPDHVLVMLGNFFYPHVG